MSAVPFIPPSGASSGASQDTRSQHRPKRIQPPAHWKTDAKPAVKKAAAPASAPALAMAPAHAPRMTRTRFILTLLLCVAALNAVLLWLFPLPNITTHNTTPVFSVAPDAEKGDLPVWLRS